MRDGYLVDTGVFLRWFVDQPGFEHARRIQQDFVEGRIHLETVDFARVEVAEVLRKKGLLASRLEPDEFVAAAQVIDELGIVVHTSDADRLGRAVTLATQHPLRIFDALFVQASIDHRLTLLTADRRLGRAVQNVTPVELVEIAE